MKNILFQVTADDRSYLSLLKPILGGRANVRLNDTTPTALLEVVMRAKEGNCSAVATTSSKLLQLLLGKLGEKLPSCDDYAGSIIEKHGIEFLILNPVQHLVTVPFGRHLYERYFSKLLRPEDWLQMPELSWEVADVGRLKLYEEFFAGCDLISGDIETIPCEEPEDPRVISCIGFTGCIFGAGEYTTHTVVFPFTYEFLPVIRKIAANKVAKTFQNGKYDNGWLLLYNTPVTRWQLDTAHMFHSWMSELPKRLDFITSYMLRKWQFWKDEAKTTDLHQYYAYNAKDCHGTLCATLALLNEMPDWAMRNFIEEFSVVPACLLSEMTGIKTDKSKMAEMRAQMAVTEGVNTSSLQKMLAWKTFNPGSPKQVLTLFKALGSGDIKNTTPPSMDKVKSRHPLNNLLLSTIQSIRKDRKLVSNYLVERKLWHGRLFYDINPHGTDTGRNAAQESKFWCGFQIQNQPRDREDISIKEQYVADNGFYFGEADFEQAEARGTGYLSGDENLIAAVDGVKDFHGVNASAFFGIPYEKIVETKLDEASGKWLHKVLDKALRDLAKRVNHGSNYNMGEQVMLDTMGIKNVIRAQKLLGLPANWSLLQVTKYLLNVYAKSYPQVKGDWYDSIKAAVRDTKLLVSATGWTRYCFGDPIKNKRHLNSYVAHVPQNLNAMILNKAYRKVFLEVALQHPRDFKLLAQIHDSILFQYRIGRKDLALKVADCMIIPTPVTDCKGKSRILTVPVALKGEARKWSDVETIAA